MTVELPKCKSAGSLDLTITERQVSLHSIDVGPYHLDLRLPYGVLEVCWPALPVLLMADHTRSFVMPHLIAAECLGLTPAHSGRLLIFGPFASTRTSLLQDAGSAKFDKKARTLTVVLPVVHPKPEPELMSDTPAISREEDVVAQDASANTDTSASPQDAESIRTASPVATEASLPATDASAPMPEQLAQPSKQTSQGGDKRAGAVAAEETKPLPIFRMKQTAEAVSVVVDVPGLASSSVDLSFEAAVFGPITTHTAVLRLPAHSLLLKYEKSPDVAC